MPFSLRVLSKDGVTFLLYAAPKISSIVETEESWFSTWQLGYTHSVTRDAITWWLKKTKQPLTEGTFSTFLLLVMCGEHGLDNNWW
jgi:hypothetical protein